MKQIVKVLKNVMKNRDREEVLKDLVMPGSELDLILDGTMEISPMVAVKFEKVFGIDAHDLLAAQSADQLETLGHQRIKKVKVPEATTRTDGQPSQSPVFGKPRSQTGRAVG
jgi:plasmid maintenance system antidote protein VapI